MKNLFYMGGPLFMSILTILFIIALVWAIINIAMFYKTKNVKDVVRKRFAHVKSVGLLALITGVLGQFVGLSAAFYAIEQAADISPTLIFGGLKVSMIPTMYGMCIYLLSILVWIVFDVLILGRD